MSENKAKLQTIFDRVVSHLLKQGKASVGKYGCSYYVREENLRCAIGGAVNKDVARHLQSRFGGTGIVVGSPIEKEKTLVGVVCDALDLEITNENVGFLSNLQDMHDSCRDEDDFCNTILVDAKRVARDYELSFSY